MSLHRFFAFTSAMIGAFALTAAPPAFADAPTVLAGGFDYMCSLTKTEGNVRCWGARTPSGSAVGGNLPFPAVAVDGVVSIANGSEHSCALRSDGAVFCWGDNLYYQLGNPANGDTVRSNIVPQPVVGLSGAAIGIYSGPTASHSCALIANGSVQCWGYNSSGQLGDGTTKSNVTPQTVPGLSGVLSLAMGTNHTCALLADGGIKCWGYNGYGGLGDGTYKDRLTPTGVLGLSGPAVSVAVGQNFTCAAMRSGSVQCFGKGGPGTLGQGGPTTSGDTEHPYSPVPLTVIGITGSATAVVAGGEYACALLTSGAVQCWGRRPYGSGDGIAWTSSADIVQPSAVTVVGLSAPVVSLGASYRYVCAALVGGLVECWGDRPVDGGNGAINARASAHLGGYSLDTRLIMTELRHASLDYFFITSRYQEKLILKAFAPEFQPTGKSFMVNPTGLAAGSKPITRFYFDKVAKSGGRGSHFYTLVDAERTALAGMNPSNSNTPKLPQSEGTDSFAFAPAIEGVGGSCAAGQTPLYRAFRGARFPDDPNHRFTTDLVLYNSLVTTGWDGEGVKMCVSP